MTNALPNERAAGTIYDLGYQHYEGKRLGRANAVRTLIGFSFRSAFGLGRGEKAKAIPSIMLLLVFFPAVIQIAIAAASGRQDVINFAQHLQFVALFLSVFAAAQAPELVVTDRQHGVLALYLSRSLRPTDYALSKLVAFIAAFLVMTLGPELVLFLGKVLSSASPWSALQTDWKLLGPIIGGTGLASCYLASIGLALASYTSRRALASASVLGFFLLMSASSGIAMHIATGDARRYAVLLNPFAVMTGFANWLFDVQAQKGRRGLVVRANLPGEWYLYVIAGTCVIGVAALLWRYRRSDV